MRFCERLKEAMETGNLKQKDVAELSGYSKGTVSQWLSGCQSPPKKVMPAIAEALSLPADYFSRSTGAFQEGSKVFITPEEASEIIGLSPEFIRQGIAQGKLPWGYAVQMGSRAPVIRINRLRMLAEECGQDYPHPEEEKAPESPESA